MTQSKSNIWIIKKEMIRIAQNHYKCLQKSKANVWLFDWHDLSKSLQRTSGLSVDQ